MRTATRELKRRPVAGRLGFNRENAASDLRCVDLEVSPEVEWADYFRGSFTPGKLYVAKAEV